MSTITEKCMVLPFTVEADLPRNGHLVIQSIPGRKKLRSAFDGAKTVRRGGDGPDANDQVIPPDQNKTFGDHPKVPGQRITVNPENLTYEIIDPVHGDKEMCAKIKRWLVRTGIVDNSERDGFPSVKGKLDIHRFKTLCRELIQIVASGEGKFIGGYVPSIEDIDELKGNYLLNPGSTIRNGQPRFEKDYEKWEQQLQAMGG